MSRATRLQKSAWANSNKVLYKFFEKQFWPKWNLIVWRGRWSWMEMPFCPEVGVMKRSLSLPWIYPGELFLIDLKLL
jgi:hypothetical protein